MYFGEKNIYIPPNGVDDIIAGLDHSVQNRAHVVSQVPRICTLIGPSGSGKTALIDYWRKSASGVVRPDEVVYICLSPPSNEYRSMSHMVLARILDTLEIMFAPAYTPVRSRVDEADSAERFGKKQLEALRKKVDRKLAERPIRAIIVDDIHHIDKHALHYLLARRMGLSQGALTPKRALILVGREKESAKPENQLHTWLNRSEAQRHYTEQHTLKHLEKNERKAIIKRLLEEGLRATVLDDDLKIQVNREIGELVDSTEGNWMRIEHLIRTLDDNLKPQPNGSPRHITPEVLQRVRGKMWNTGAARRSDLSQSMLS